MIVLCININTRGERMVPTYEGGWGTSTVVGEKLWSNCFGTKNRARRLIFFCLKGLEVYFGIKTLIKDLRLPNDFKWLLKTCSDFQKLLHFSSKNMGMLHIKRKLVIRVTHWKWENGILRSSEVIWGQKPQKMTNRKIFHSTLFMQVAFGTLNKDRGLIFFYSPAYALNYIELSIFLT